MKKISIIIVLIIFSTIGLLGVVSLNGLETSYDDTGESTNKSGNNQIKDLVILGAGYFLKSHADFQLFLHQVELSGLTGANYDELQNTLNSVIHGMESARTTYLDLKNLAANTPYNPEIIENLRTFDYQDFFEVNNLNLQVSAQVETLLSQGNVNGIIEKIFSYTFDILEFLYAVKKSLDKNLFPEISQLWQLNQIYSNSLFFGQYTAMVFLAIK